MDNDEPRQEITEDFHETEALVVSELKGFWNAIHSTGEVAGERYEGSLAAIVAAMDINPRIAQSALLWPVIDIPIWEPNLGTATLVEVQTYRRKQTETYGG